MAVVTGTAANDVLVGTGKNDTLNGLTGADKMAGGFGNDTYFVDQAGDLVTELANRGLQDWIVSSITTTLSANVENLELVGGARDGRGNALGNTILGNTLANRIDGGLGNDLIAGNGGNDTLAGGAGDDYLVGGGGTNLLLGGAGNDWLSGVQGESVMQGGAGNDDYYVNSAGDRVIERAGEGIDRISSATSFDLAVGGANVERLFLAGSNLTGLGNALDNFIEGNSGNDTLGGRAGDDRLLGYQGKDTLNGGTGNDVLNGGEDDDFMSGGKGNDIYYVDSALDEVKELTGEGIDEVRSGQTVDLDNIGYYTGGPLKAFHLAEVENVTLIGGGNVHAFGNALNNVLKGTAGNNTLNGRGGNDTLIAGAGEDSLIGGAGRDVMIGGKGNDFYYVDNAKDTVIESAGIDTDQVHSSISYVLGANVENLILGDFNINGTGNGLDNRIAGGAGNNKINGGAGNDTLEGGAGNDAMLGGVGNDLLYGDIGNDSLEGGAGNDFLQGNDGDDILRGGLGDDFYYIEDVDDAVVELAGQGRDTIQSEIDFDLSVNGVNVENLYVTGSGDHFGIGNTFNNYLQGGSGKNLLDGGAGNDTIYGGLGDDTLKGGNGDDQLIGGPGTDLLIGGKGNDIYYLGQGIATIDDSGGIDTVVNDATTDLDVAGFKSIENLTLTGGAVIDGYGNALNNVIKGNAGDNSLLGDAGNDTLFGGSGHDGLVGGAGKDLMIGGKGNDYYFVYDAGDKVLENAKEGVDTVVTSFTSYVLGANLEILAFDTLSAVVGTGNTLSNTIYGGVGNDRLDGKEGNDFLIGYTGNDTLIGGDGSDTLDGGTESDRMIGGKGDDRYYVDNVADRVIELAGQGLDSIYSEISFDLNGFANLGAPNVEVLVLLGTGNHNGTGNELNNLIFGNDGNNNLNGVGGNDSLAGGGGNDGLTGEAGNDTLRGGDGNDYLSGGAGRDILDGGAGTNTLIGGSGNDLYIVRSDFDEIVEGLNGGIDEIRTELSQDLLFPARANVENVTLTGSTNAYAYGNELANILIGNSGNNILDGGDGNDILAGGLGNDALFGGTGQDKLAGGKGNDYYYVDSTKDIVIENAKEGVDQVLSSVSYSLGANVEELVLTSAGNVNGTGNTLDNVIYGYVGRNKLDGGAGNDTLLGGDGNDLLLGGGGKDILIGDSGDDDMRGGAGDDIYYVDSVGDKVTELAGQGRDRIMSSIAFDLALGGANVEDLILTGALDIDGLGNNLGNFIFGTSGKNLLNGRGGNDVLVDVAGQNTLLGGAGNDEISGGGDADTLNGGAGNDTLKGGGGADLLIGGQGNDTYVLSDGSATLVEGKNEGIDLVRSRFDHTLGANFENLTLTGKDSIGGTGNTLANIITGNNAGNTLYGDAGNDRLIGNGGQDILNGGLGADAMFGGAGGDLYYVDNVGDKVVEAFKAGFDVVVTTLSSYTLGANVEGLDFTGPGNAVGTGNALANEISGDVGNDKLDGQAGNDTVFGGDGNDILIGGLGNDILSGSDGSDTLIGGAGNDALFGDFGKNVMIGGAGDDRYSVYDADDVVQEAANGGTDLVYTLVSMTLAANVENAELIIGNLSVTGNNLDNRITGSAGSDTIAGGLGADMLLGLGGNDRLIGGAGADVIEGGLGADTINGGAGSDVIRYTLDAPADLGNLGGDLITGFETGKDKIDLYDLFSDFDIRTEDVVGKGYLQLFVSGNDTLLLFDADGGGDSFVTLATLQNVTNAKLTDLVYQQGPIID